MESINQERKRCAICNNILSSYNKSDVCFCHTQDENKQPESSIRTPIWKSTFNSRNWTVDNEYGFYG